MYYAGKPVNSSQGVMSCNPYLLLLHFNINHWSGLLYRVRNVKLVALSLLFFFLFMLIMFYHFPKINSRVIYSCFNSVLYNEFRRIDYWSYRCKVFSFITLFRWIIRYKLTCDERWWNRIYYRKWHETVSIDDSGVMRKP